jgi:hypothetical protein
MSERYPVYAEANLVVDTSNEPIGATVQKVLQALATTWPLRQQSADSAP